MHCFQLRPVRPVSLMWYTTPVTMSWWELRLLSRMPSFRLTRPRSDPGTSHITPPHLAGRRESNWWGKFNVRLRKVMKIRRNSILTIYPPPPSRPLSLSCHMLQLLYIQWKNSIPYPPTPLTCTKQWLDFVWGVLKTPACVSIQFTRHLWRDYLFFYQTPPSIFPSKFDGFSKIPLDFVHGHR